MSFSLAALLGSAALLAAPAPSACSGPAYAALDFWVGTWAVEWKRDDGTSGVGRNVVTRDLLDGCVVQERFVDTTTGFSGISQSAYNQFAKAWVMAWADNRGMPFIARSSATPTPAGELVFDLDGGGPRNLRIVFEAITTDGFTWRFQARPKGTEAWIDLTVSTYRRVAAASGDPS